MGICIAYHRAFMLVKCGNPLDGVIVDRQYLLGIRQKLEPDLGKADRACGTMKELGVEFGLQTLNLPRYGRLRKR